MKGFSETHAEIMNEIADVRNGFAGKSALVARISQRLFQLSTDGLENLYAGKLLTVTGHNGPGCVGSIGQTDHVIYRRFILRPLLPVAPVFLGYFVPFVRDF